MKIVIKLFFVATLTVLLSSCAQPPLQQTQYSTKQSQLEKNKNSVTQYASDAFITSKIKAKYLKDLKLKFAGISVSTNQGVVNLMGVLPDQATKDRAIAIAENTKGVKTVDASNLTNTIKAMSLQPPK